LASNDLVEDVAAFLQTLAADDTLKKTLRHTVVPPLGDLKTTSKRALEVLERLASASAEAGAHIELRETIGEGGMGIVRLGVQLALGRNVAVKTLRDDRRSDEATLDLLHEAWITGSLEHPNVVPVYDITLDESGTPVIVLKRIEGVGWDELIDDLDEVRQRFDANDLLEWNLGILLQVINAVRFAHSRGIIHRDLKPENVMIGEFGEVYLVDWGIAVALVDDGTGRMPLAANCIDMAGTPCYMAPEMLGREDSPPLSEATDVYLLGSILYEIITGDPPHDGDSAMEVVSKIAQSDPQFPPGAPTGLVRICRRCMDPDPHGRFERAEQVRLAVNGFLQHRGSERLAAVAVSSLDELQVLLRTPRTDSTYRQDLYRHYGECRLGFREALRAWAQNATALDGVRTATLAMIEYELGQGDARAAESLLVELGVPPATLRDRIDDALRQAEAKRARAEELERDHDFSAGARTRTFFAVVLGLAWTGAPLLGALSADHVRYETHTNMTLWCVGFLFVIGGLGVWARDSMMKSAINRRIFVTLMFTFTAQGLMNIAFGSAGLPPELTQVTHIFLWFSVGSMLAITIDWRLFAGALGYLTAFFVAIHEPDLRYYAMSASNFAVMLNCVIIWRPNSMFTRDESPD
jgi:serine/threonine-protein kinase